MDNVLDNKPGDSPPAKPAPNLAKGLVEFAEFVRRHGRAGTGVLTGTSVIAIGLTESAFNASLIVGVLVVYRVLLHLEIRGAFGLKQRGMDQEHERTLKKQDADAEAVARADRRADAKQALDDARAAEEHKAAVAQAERAAEFAHKELAAKTKREADIIRAVHAHGGEVNHARDGYTVKVSPPKGPPVSQGAASRSRPTSGTSAAAPPIRAVPPPPLRELGARP